MSAQRLYLDANATTPPAPAVMDAMQEALTQNWGNPSSQHAEGRKARRRLQQATDTTARYLGTTPDWITWTSGGSEAINMWITGLLPQTGDGRRIVITTPGEHPAALRPLTTLEAAGRIELCMLPVDALGRVQPDELAALLKQTEPANILSVMLIAAHNETGGTQPLDQLAPLCRAHRVPLFCDGVQWTAKKDIDLDALGIDGWAVSFHKLGGPKGIGVLAARPGILAQPLIYGGPQQKKRRGGTENMPGIAGAEAALQLAESEWPARQSRWQRQMEVLRQGIPGVWPDAELLHDAEDGLPQTLLVRFPGWRGDEMSQRLDLEGIAVSTGSACSSGAVQASEALLGMGMDSQVAEQLVRISLPPDVPQHAAETLLSILEKIHAAS